jgi:ubiquinone biosynthesis monooxygenase Coq7
MIPPSVVGDSGSSTIARIVKVNHAGEYAAIRIYQAQIMCARYVAPDISVALQQILEHERRHLTEFRQAMPSRASRPCRTMWLWALGGFVLGLFTGVLGRNGIWACTLAVETTVHSHLEDQLNFLRSRDPELYAQVDAIRMEEQEHLDHAEGELPATYFLLRPLYWVISRATDLVIWLSTWGDSARLARELKQRR